MKTNWLTAWYFAIAILLVATLEQPDFDEDAAHIAAEIIVTLISLALGACAIKWGLDSLGK